MSNNSLETFGFLDRTENLKSIESTLLAEPTLNLGPGGVIRTHRLIGIFEANSLPMKRLRDKAYEDGRLIDVTKGKKTKSILVTDSNHVILSSVVPQTLIQRLKGEKSSKNLAQLEWEEGEFVS